MKLFYLLPLLPAARSGRTRNYRGILSLTYRWGSKDREEKQLPKQLRLKNQMLELLAGQRKSMIRERIHLLSDYFLTPSKNEKDQ